MIGAGGVDEPDSDVLGPDKGATAGRRLSVRVRVAAGTALLVAATVGVLVGERYVWADRLLNHPFGFGVLAWVLLSAVLIGRLRPGLVQAVLFTGALCGGLVLAGAGVLSSGVGLPSAGEEAAAPGASWFAVAAPYTKVIDPAHALTIRQSRGLLSKQWPAGCLNGDAPGDGYASMGWVSDRELHVRTADGRVLSVRVDPGTGQPQNQVRTGAGC
jgi:hypothetical protein